ncbi:MAG: hypothetical protein P1U30_09485 [Phycisphaerales bacterium]|nr:hypothetical protein [Phycisphaerales bacterium]
MALVLVEDRRGVLSGSIVVSVLLHVLGAAVVLTTGLPIGNGSDALDSREQLIPPLEQEEDELKLGIDAASTASIDWLGIDRPEEVVGEAEISETNQAAQTLVVGENEQVAVEETVVEPVEETLEQLVDTPEVQQAIEGAVEQVQESIEKLAEPFEAVETLIDDAAVLLESTEAAVEEQIKEEVKEEVETGQSAEVNEQVAAERAPKPIGTAGELSEKESVATRIKKALEMDPHKANAPVVGKGLEIITVRPRYTSAVRLSAIPKNPVVVIWFDATGKVRKAEFLRDGRIEYSSGVVGVDEPLLNAIYRWKAKGKQIDELDPADPESLVEVTIKIVYQRERKIVTD